MSAKEAREFTKAEIWAMPGVGIGLALIAMILAVIVYEKQQNLSGNGQLVNSIATASGFMGTINSTGQAVISLNVGSGLLASNGNGSLTLASSSDVTSVRLDGFASTIGNITASDTIISALGKAIVFSQTLLTGFIPSVGVINSSDTTMSGLQKLSGSITAWSPYLFSMYQGNNITSSTLAPLWNSSKVKGSTTIGAGVLKEGSSLTIRSFGTIVTGGTPNSVTFVFQLDGQSLLNIVTGNLPRNGTWYYQHRVNIFAPSGGTSMNLVATLEANNPAWGVVFGSAATNQGLSSPVGNSHTLGLNGSISSGNNNVLSCMFSTCALDTNIPA